MKERIHMMLRQLAADKKKLWIMAVLVLVGLLLWGRLIFKRAPQSALAKPEAEVAQVEAAADDEPSVAARKVVEVDLADDLIRNIFRFDRSYYQTIEPENPGNSESDQADTSIQTADAAILVDEYKLETTMGALAVINGRSLRRGQRLRGFTLTEIALHHVVLEKDGEKVMLRMATD